MLVTSIHRYIYTMASIPFLRLYLSWVADSHFGNRGQGFDLEPSLGCLYRKLMKVCLRNKVDFRSSLLYLGKSYSCCCVLTTLT